MRVSGSRASRVRGAALGGGDPAQGEQVAPDVDQPEQGARALGSVAVGGRTPDRRPPPLADRGRRRRRPGCPAGGLQEGPLRPRRETVFLRRRRPCLRRAGRSRGSGCSWRCDTRRSPKRGRKSGAEGSCPPAPAGLGPAGCSRCGGARVGRRGGGWCGRRRGAAGGGEGTGAVAENAGSSRAPRARSRPSSSEAVGLSASSQTEARPARQDGQAPGTSPRRE